MLSEASSFYLFYRYIHTEPCGRLPQRPVPGFGKPSDHEHAKPAKQCPPWTVSDHCPAESIDPQETADERPRVVRLPAGREPYCPNYRPDEREGNRSSDRWDQHRDYSWSSRRRTSPSTTATLCRSCRKDQTHWPSSRLPAGSILTRSLFTTIVKCHKPWC